MKTNVIWSYEEDEDNDEPDHGYATHRYTPQKKHTTRIRRSLTESTGSSKSDKSSNSSNLGMSGHGYGRGASPVASILKQPDMHVSDFDEDSFDGDRLEASRTTNTSTISKKPSFSVKFSDESTVSDDDAVQSLSTSGNSNTSSGRGFSNSSLGLSTSSIKSLNSSVNNSVNNSSSGRFPPTHDENSVKSYFFTQNKEEITKEDLRSTFNQYVVGNRSAFSKADKTNISRDLRLKLMAPTLADEVLGLPGAYITWDDLEGVSEPYLVKKHRDPIQKISLNSSLPTPTAAASGDRVDSDGIASHATKVTVSKTSIKTVVVPSMSMTGNMPLESDNETDNDTPVQQSSFTLPRRNDNNRGAANPLSSTQESVFSVRKSTDSMRNEHWFEGDDEYGDDNISLSSPASEQLPSPQLSPAHMTTDTSYPSSTAAPITPLTPRSIASIAKTAYEPIVTLEQPPHVSDRSTPPLPSFQRDIPLVSSSSTSKFDYGIPPSPILTNNAANSGNYTNDTTLMDSPQSRVDDYGIPCQDASMSEVVETDDTDLQSVHSTIQSSRRSFNKNSQSFLGSFYLSDSSMDESFYTPRRNSLTAVTKTKTKEKVLSRQNTLGTLIEAEGASEDTDDTITPKAGVTAAITHPIHSPSVGSNRTPDDSMLDQSLAGMESHHDIAPNLVPKLATSSHQLSRSTDISSPRIASPRGEVAREARDSRDDPRPKLVIQTNADMLSGPISSSSPRNSPKPANHPSFPHFPQPAVTQSQPSLHYSQSKPKLSRFLTTSAVLHSLTKSFQRPPTPKTSINATAATSASTSVARHQQQSSSSSSPATVVNASKSPINNNMESTQIRQQASLTTVLLETFPTGYRTEFAIHSRVVLETWLEKKSTLTGFWHKKYYLLRECAERAGRYRLCIYRRCAEAVWGTIPLEMTGNYYVDDIIDVKLVNVKSGREFELVIKLPELPSSSSGAVDTQNNNNANVANQSAAQTVIATPSNAGSMGSLRRTLSGMFTRSANGGPAADNLGMSNHSEERDSVASSQDDQGNTKVLTLRAVDPQTRWLWITILQKMLGIDLATSH